MISVEEIRKAQRAQGTATVLAIGTANPPHYFEQSKFPDTYFRMTHDDHMIELKKKMQRMCKNISTYSLLLLVFLFLFILLFYCHFYIYCF